MESFKFRLSKELIEVAGYDVKYEAIESESKRFIEVWFQEPGEEEGYALYEEAQVKECLDRGEWIKVN